MTSPISETSMVNSNGPSTDPCAPANNIDGVRGSEEITSHFCDIYKDIYNRHQTTDSVNHILGE